MAMPSRFSQLFCVGKDAHDRRGAMAVASPIADTEVVCWESMERLWCVTRYLRVMTTEARKLRHKPRGKIHYKAPTRKSFATFFIDKSLQC